MIDNLISLSLVWILVGSLVWAFSDPVRLYDMALRRFIQQHGRLPRKGVIVMTTLCLIVLWPKLARALWERA